MGRGRKKADPIAKEDRLIGDELVSKMNSASEQELRDMASKNDMDRVAWKELQKTDPDLSDLKEKLKTANEPYREGHKRLDAISRRIKQRLEAMGKDTGSGDLPETPKPPSKPAQLAN